MDYSVGSFCRVSFTTQGTQAHCCYTNLQPVVYPQGTSVYALTNGFLFRCTSLLQTIWQAVIMSYIKELHISHKYLCTECYGNHVDTARAKHLKDNNLRMTCHTCGEILAKERRHTIAPLNKSNYICITDMAMLKQLNPKRTTWKQ